MVCYNTNCFVINSIYAYLTVYYFLKIKLFYFGWVNFSSIRKEAILESTIFIAKPNQKYYIIQCT